MNDVMTDKLVVHKQNTAFTIFCQYLVFRFFVESLFCVLFSKIHKISVTYLCPCAILRAKRSVLHPSLFPSTERS